MSMLFKVNVVREMHDEVWVIADSEDDAVYLAEEKAFGPKEIDGQQVSQPVIGDYSFDLEEAPFYDSEQKAWTDLETQVVVSETRIEG